MRTIFTFIAIAVTTLLAGCAAPPNPSAGATAPTYGCTYGRYGGTEATVNCDRGLIESSR